MLSQKEILSSDIVANATMNRGRGLSGVNSYARELRMDITQFLRDSVLEGGTALWYDACCGEGRALVEADVELSQLTWGKNVEIVGVDLAGLFTKEHAGTVRLIADDVAAYAPDKPASLVTCVHGLHYLGDKIGFIEHAYRLLAPNGVFVGNLDLGNVRAIDGMQDPMRKAIRHARTRGIAVKLRNNVLSITRTDADLDFGLTFHGATISERPNYTGITVIDSWYSRRDKYAAGADGT